MCFQSVILLQRAVGLLTWNIVKPMQFLGLAMSACGAALAISTTAAHISATYAFLAKDGMNYVADIFLSIAF
jgi:hypothetical protein